VISGLLAVLIALCHGVTAVVCYFVDGYRLVAGLQAL
jgi:hypothetical protein